MLPKKIEKLSEPAALELAEGYVDAVTGMSAPQGNYPKNISDAVIEDVADLYAAVEGDMGVEEADELELQRARIAGKAAAILTQNLYFDRF
jgi:hypothetical protein